MSGATAVLPLVARLDAFGRDDVSIAGGKGANLGELVRAGFPVPSGFVVTTRAYALVAATGPFAASVAALAKISPSDTSALASASRALRLAFAGATIPPEVVDAVRVSLQLLGSVPVAVRSSATAEDLPGATFAGQQDTELNVVGADDVLDAVRRCWGSLWSERAIAYRQQRGIDHAGVRLAVVVQTLVDANVAGVLFTANPLTGARDELVIDASPGLGEAVVSGMVTPDHFVVSKGTHAVVAQQVGRREVVIRPAAGGGTEVVRSPGTSSALVLAAPDLKALAGLGEAVERHFGSPQDVEWALVAGRLFVLQSRPITALPPEPSGLAAGVPVAAPVAVAKKRKRRGFQPPNFAGELFPLRPYPLDASSHMRVLLQGLGDAMTGPLGVTFPTVDRLLVEEDGLPVRVNMDGAMGRSWRVLYKPWLSLWQRRHLDLSRWSNDPVIAEATRRAHALERRSLAALSWGEVLATFHAALDLIPSVLTLRKKYLVPAIKDMALLWLLLRLTGQHGRFGALTSGVENVTLELNRALEALAATVRDTPALRALFAETACEDVPAALARLATSSDAGDAAAAPAAGAFLAAFERFLDEYGHRETAILFVSQPTWKDDPAVPLAIIASLSTAPPAPVVAGPAAWEIARDEALAHSVLGKGPLRRLFLRRLARGRVLSRLREDSHFHMGLPLPAERRCALELGRRLVSVGVLDDALDVFLLRLEELDSLGHPWPPLEATVRRLKTLVEGRKARRAALADVPVVAPDPAAALDLVEGALLAGQPGSAGAATGPVRVIRGPADFGRLRPGDVLVAPFTNPAWTPLFPRASAVVVDTGATMSHAAIVAREYGIPAVMGTRHATTLLADGQWVRVDGSRGLVFPAVAPT